MLVVLYSALTAIRDCTPPTVDAAHCIIGAFLGRPRRQPKPYNELVWFWSDQGDLKLMIAGLAHGVDQWVARGDPATRAFSTFGLRDGKLAVVESVNRAGDHAAAKRIIGTTKSLTPEEAVDPAFDLRGVAKR
jgi:3-phenylpropionate/trans-cinnamate dioxygenase ferredoxin reductase subunit